MRAILIALLALGGAGASAQSTAPQRWNPAAPENRQVLPAFNYAVVEGVLNAIGARHQRSSTNPAHPAIIATFANGRRARITLGGCDSRGSACKSLGILSTYPAVPASAQARLGQAVHQFNRRYAFSQASIMANGQPALQRYLTADYGFIRGNLAVNLLVFATQSDRFVGEVLRPLQGQRP